MSGLKTFEVAGGGEPAAGAEDGGASGGTAPSSAPRRASMAATREAYSSRSACSSARRRSTSSRDVGAWAAAGPTPADNNANIQTDGNNARFIADSSVQTDGPERPPP